QWPPPGATRVELDGAYERLNERGYGYGPAFQGLTAAWRRGDELFAEVALPEGVQGEAARYGMHPALLDTAMHVDVLVDHGEGGTEALLPFAWNGVTLHASGASALRVYVRRIRGAEESVMVVADGTGQPVMTVASLICRPVSPEALRAGNGTPSEDLHRLEWTAVPAPADGTPPSYAVIGADGLAGLSGSDAPPPVVIAPCATPRGDVLDAMRSVTSGVLALVQGWLADPRTEESTLVVVTQNAVATAEGADVDLAQAPVWGLVRAAQAENPGRIVLLDSDTPADAEDVAARLATAAALLGEPELALRDGRFLIPRLLPALVPEGSEPWDTDGTVLVTGGTGGLGALIARHLVAEHGVRHLVLT
ncbi:polyketide synthase dehydratase domain-containing protein, partial [Streptomyces carpinensis]